jgi:phosphoesterase RecJ-like protein
MSNPVLSLRVALTEAKSVLLTGPMDPDGDSFGACLALGRAAAGFSSASIHIAGAANYRYDWMPDADGLRSDAELDASYDLVVVMDGDRGRLTPRVTEIFAAAKTTALVDHHGSSSADGYGVVILNPDSPSTCEMVYQMFCEWGVAMDQAMATQLYTGIIFDTGGFKHENTQAATHRLAAELLDLGVSPAPIHGKVLNERTVPGLGLLGEVLSAAQFYHQGMVVIGKVTEEASRRLGIRSGDTEGVIDTMLNTAGVEVAVLATEAKGAVKLSFRSKTRVNVAAIAADLAGGGGHVRAAGARFQGSMDELMGRLPAILGEAVS